MRVALFTLALICAIPMSVHGKLTITKAYYRDPNASLHVFLKNQGRQPVRLLPPIVDDFDCATIDEHNVNRPQDVLWYRMRPNTIAPGEIANILITLSTPTNKSKTVEIRTTNGETIKTVIRCVAEPLRFQAIRFAPDLKTIDVYVRWANPTKSSLIKSILLDGKDVHRFASPWPAKAYDGLAFTRIVLEKPLAKNSFHVIEAKSIDGLSTAYQIRAMPAEFLIGVYGTPTAENIADWSTHGCNHYLSFGVVQPDILEIMSKHRISVGAKYIPEPLVDRSAGKIVNFNEDIARKNIEEIKNKQAFLYHHLVDEPDVADHYGGRQLGISAMELAARDEFCAKVDPEHYTFVQLDNTFRPQNYRVYGEIADVIATHRYSLGNFLRSEAGQETYTRPPFLRDLLETIEKLKLATEPKPFFMVTQFFNLGERRSGRAPTIEEMRLQCYAMVLGGARGIIHYIHSGSTGGGEGGRVKTLWDAMTTLHNELRRVGEVAAIGTPAPANWAKCNTPNVLPGAILCGDKIVVVLINLSHRSSLETFAARPVREAIVTVKIPPWLDANALKVVALDSGDLIESQLQEDMLSFKINEIIDARCFLLSRQIGQ
ncbi:MAG: hypothetical protein K6T99_11675 [Armatimonadetes bacterium]|nr:hypothetical protein [Armatimonadota bacterium]